jgi:hypothetical protein
MGEREAGRTAIRVAVLRAAHRILDGEPKILADPIGVGLVPEASEAALRADSRRLERPAEDGCSHGLTSTRSSPVIRCQRPDRSPLHLMERISRMRNRMRESCSSGSAGGEGGNRLAYPAYTGRAADVVARAAFDPERTSQAIPLSCSLLG